MKVYRPIDVLEKQVEVMGWWQRSPTAQTYRESFQNPMALTTGSTSVPLDRFLVDRLNTAETYFVTSNITQKLWEFADQYETHDVVLPQDLPSPRGFVWLDTPVYQTDARARKCSVRAILWSREVGGILLVLFSDRDDFQDDLNSELRSQFGTDFLRRLDCPLPPLHVTSWSFGKKVRNLSEEDFSIPPWITAADREEWYDKNFAKGVEDQVHFNSFLMAFWSFVQEVIPAVSYPDRPMRKRLLRAHSPLHEVNVVDLRPVAQHHEHSDNPQVVVWNHRWRVREHKRHWIDKHGVYRETTVSAHIKGPEHLPLVEKDRVFNVRK